VSERTWEFNSPSGHFGKIKWRVPARGGLIRLPPKAHADRLLESLIEQVLSPAQDISIKELIAKYFIILYISI